MSFKFKYNFLKMYMNLKIALATEAHLAEGQGLEGE
jgi:hypothetical protein